MTDKVMAPASHAPTGNRYRDKITAGRPVHISQLLRDDAEMDMLAVRDNVLGLEAELVNARAEAAHWFAIAMALRTELGETSSDRILRRVRTASHSALVATRELVANKGAR